MEWQIYKNGSNEIQEAVNTQWNQKETLIIRNACGLSIKVKKASKSQESGDIYKYN